jgi:hypothetical protein
LSRSGWFPELRPEGPAMLGNRRKEFPDGLLLSQTNDSCSEVPSICVAGLAKSQTEVCVTEQPAAGHLKLSGVAFRVPTLVGFFLDSKNPTEVGTPKL